LTAIFYVKNARATQALSMKGKLVELPQVSIWFVRVAKFHPSRQG
jgi:hypothetical protein